MAPALSETLDGANGLVMIRRVNTAFKLTPWEEELLRLYDSGLGPTEIKRALGLRQKPGQALNAAIEKRNLQKITDQDPRGGGTNTLAVARGHKNRTYDPRLGLWKHG